MNRAFRLLEGLLLMGVTRVPYPTWLRGRDPDAAAVHAITRQYRFGPLLCMAALVPAHWSANLERREGLPY